VGLFGRAATASRWYFSAAGPRLLPTLGRNLLCIAGGSGISGMMSIARAAGALFRAVPGGCSSACARCATLFFLDELSSNARVSITSRYPTSSSSNRNARWPALAFAHGLVHEVPGKRWPQV